MHCGQLLETAKSKGCRAGELHWPFHRGLCWQNVVCSSWLLTKTSEIIKLQRLPRLLATTADQLHRMRSSSACASGGRPAGQDQCGGLQDSDYCCWNQLYGPHRMTMCWRYGRYLNSNAAASSKRPCQYSPLLHVNLTFWWSWSHTRHNYDMRLQGLLELFTFYHKGYIEL